MKQRKGALRGLCLCSGVGCILGKLQQGLCPQLEAVGKSKLRLGRVRGGGIAQHTPIERCCLLV